MSKLGAILAALVAQTEGNHPPCPASTTLKSGLRATAAVRSTDQQTVLLLSRTPSTPPSHKEAEVCADHLGWAHPVITSYTSRGGKPCLMVVRGGDQPETSTQQSAGTCTHQFEMTAHVNLGPSGSAFGYTCKRCGATASKSDQKRLKRDGGGWQRHLDYNGEAVNAATFNQLVKCGPVPVGRPA